MKKVKVASFEFDLEDNEAALCLSIQELTAQIKRLANK